MTKVYVTALVVIPLAATIFALAAFSWYRGSIQDVLLFVSFYIAVTLGVSIGFHRLVTHRGFESEPLLKAILIMFGCGALEGTPLKWAATHIKHHAHADKEGDPHSPTEGLWHAHVGWLTDLNNWAKPEEYAPHLLRDEIVMFFHRTYFLWFGLSLLLPFLLGGWSGLLWGGLVRIFFLHHVTWSVNSICHLFGRRDYKTTDQSSNNWVVGLLALGEGWHNNHHAFPQSAFHGLRFWQLDVSAYLIRAFRALGMVWNVNRPSSTLLAAKALPRTPHS